MGITDNKVMQSANVAKHAINFGVPTTAVSQTALLVGAWTPGFKFQVAKVSVFATAITATITVDVQIGGVSVLTGQITPVAGSEVAGTLVTTLASLRGSATGQIQVKYTSGAAGAATNLNVKVQIRPYPLNGEV